MASPNFDTLNVRLSRMIEDKVSTATTDGDRITSARRDQLLNDAHRRLQLKWWASGQEDALRGYLNVEQQALVSSSKALTTWTGGVIGILSAYNNTDSKLVYPVSNELKEEAQTGNNVYIRGDTTNQKYYINAGNFNLLGGTATSNIRLTYIKRHTDLAANDAGGAGDTVVPSHYWDVILQEALQIYLLENPSKENVVKLQTLNG